MKSVDYIIVGDGYAAFFFAHQLILHRKSFCLFSEQKKGASRVSAGVINPAVLKRFTSFWKAQEQIDILKDTLDQISAYTGKNYLIEEPVLRIFHDEKEKQLWLQKAETEALQPFLDTAFVSSDAVINPYGCGRVKQSSRLHVQAFFEDMETYLQENGHLVAEKFQYDRLQAETSVYGNLHFRHLVFAEGMAVKNNPFFSDVPVHQNKGHHLQVKLGQKPGEPFTYKKKHFLFPLADGLYYYGGTYDREQTHEQTDPKAVQKLKEGLEEFYPHGYETVAVSFGFRPTVADRRPIVGSHMQYPNLFVLNGMGARGILNGSYFSKELFEHIENGKSLHPEVDLKRFS